MHSPQIFLLDIVVSDKNVENGTGFMQVHVRILQSQSNRMEVLQTFKQILNNYIFSGVGNKLTISTSLRSIKSLMARNLSTMVNIEVHLVLLRKKGRNSVFCLNLASFLTLDNYFVRQWRFMRWLAHPIKGTRKKSAAALFVFSLSPAKKCNFSTVFPKISRIALMKSLWLAASIRSSSRSGDIGNSTCLPCSPSEPLPCCIAPGYVANTPT